MACYVILINNDCYTVFLQEATVTGLCILPQWRMCLTVKKLGGLFRSYFVHASQ